MPAGGGAGGSPRPPPTRRRLPGGGGGGRPLPRRGRGRRAGRDARRASSVRGGGRLMLPDREILALHRTITAIPSVSGDEGAVADRLSGLLRKNGVAVTRLGAAGA